MNSFFEYEQAKKYLKILDISSNTILTEDDLKRQYLILARKYHPDMLPGNISLKEKREAEQKFKDINNANEYVKQHLFEINEIIGNSNFEGTFDSAIRKAKEDKLRKEKKSNSWNPTNEYHQDIIRQRENIIKEKEDYLRQERIKRHLRDIEERGKRDRKKALRLKRLGTFFIVVIIIFIIVLIGIQIGSQ